MGKHIAWLPIAGVFLLVSWTAHATLAGIGGDLLREPDPPPITVEPTPEPTLLPTPTPTPTPRCYVKISNLEWQSKPHGPMPFPEATVAIDGPQYDLLCSVMVNGGNGHALQVATSSYHSVACSRGVGANTVRVWTDTPNDPNVGKGVCDNYDQTYAHALSTALSAYLYRQAGPPSKP